MDIKHLPGAGSVQHYRDGCRCQDCRDAWAAYARASRAKKRDARDGNGGRPSLAAAWAAEAPAALDWPDTPAEGPVEGATCAGCGGPVFWHSAHTILLCPVCPAVATSPGARQRARAHADEADRRQARGAATVAAIDPGAEDRARGARISLHKRRKQLHRELADMLAACDPEAHDDAYYAGLGAELGDALDGYTAEINAAGDLATLDRIARELSQARDDAVYRELATDAAEVQASRADDDQGADDDYPDPGDSGHTTAPRVRRPRRATMPGFIAPDSGWRRDPQVAAYYDQLARMDATLGAPRMLPAAAALPAAQPADPGRAIDMLFANAATPRQSRRRLRWHGIPNRT